MAAILVYEGRHRVRGGLVVGAAMALLGLLFVAIGPDVISEVDLEGYVAALPPALANAFGLAALGSFAGFLAAELYQFGWVILLGIYLAYAAGGLVASDIEHGRLDLVLATATPRWRVVVERFGSLLVPIVLVNLVTFLVLAVAIERSAAADVDLARLAMVHLLSVPYLLACAAIGLVFSVVLSRGDIAQRGAMGVVFGLFMLKSVLIGTDYEPLALLSPAQYYNPTTILVEGEYALVDAAALLAGTVILLLLAVAHFERRDV